MNKTERIDKILSNIGIVKSRRDAKLVIKAGNVKVDGIIIKDHSLHVDPNNSNIEVFGELIKYKKFIYIMLNKPKDIICATFDKKQKTVIDILPDVLKKFNLFPVGRLDIDTEGLVLLTNDGELAHNMLSPKKHVEKKYFAIIQGKVTTEDIETFSNGVILEDGYKALPAKLNIIVSEEDTSEDTSNVEIIIYEGKFHQIKRMFLAVNKKVLYLKRIKIGELDLDISLKLGEFRELTEEEIEDLKTQNKECNK